MSLVLRATGGAAGACDTHEVYRALAVLADMEHGVELQALPSGRTRVIPADDLDLACQVVEGFADDRGVYWMLNPVRADLGRPARVPDVICRRWLLIDIDRVKQEENKNDSATEAEKEATRAVAEAVMGWLAGRGWPAPVLVDSGNGWHLLYRIDLPNDDDSRVLLRELLKALAARFDTPGVDLDKKVHNANRVSKLPGTMARKGVNTPERPHRMCRLVSVPAFLEVVACEQLQATLDGLRGDPSAETVVENGRPGNLVLRPTQGGSLAYATAALDREAASVALASAGTRNETLFQASISLGQLVAGGALDEATVRDRLTLAATRAGLAEGEVRATLDSGLTRGLAEPRGVPERNGATASPAPAGMPPPTDPEVIPVAWPDPPARDAFHGLAGEVVDLIDPETEADRVAILAQFLAFFGNACGRHVYRRVGAKRHYPNLFVVLVGRSAKGRKGTSLSWVESIFEAVDPAWARECVQTGLSSGEGLIHAVRDEVRRRLPGAGPDAPEEVVDPGAADKRLLVVEEEFAAVMRIAARDGNILSTVLRRAFDGTRLQTMTKHSPLRASDTHVSAVGHITREELLHSLTENDQRNGWANRFLWLAVKRSKLLADGGDLVDLTPLHARIRAALNFATHDVRMERTMQARDLWHDVYPSLAAEMPGALGMVTSRGEAVVLRLALIYALLDQSAEIDLCHLKAALALWQYSVRSCRWVFGDSTGDADADTLLAALRARGEEGMTTTEINNLFSRHKPSAVLRKLLGRLVEFGLVEAQEQQTGGRPRVVWICTDCERSE
jgi:hypothetical protein